MLQLRQMFVMHADVPFEPGPMRRLGFMKAYQRMASSDVDRCDHIIFVYRDPIERIVSVFKNKFVMRSGHIDMFASYSPVVSEDPEHATFHMFVTRYLRDDLAACDGHVLPQVRHLAPLRYTDAIPLPHLHSRMSTILGAEVANRYFKRRTNVTSDIPGVEVPGAAHLPADELARATRATARCRRPVHCSRTRSTSDCVPCTPTTCG